MNVQLLIIPILLIALLVYAIIKKVKVYDTFTQGVKGAMPLSLSIFPYLVSIFVLLELFSLSGLSDMLSNFLSPFFELLGVPSELTKLVLLKPFSGNGSLAVLNEILEKYGADSYLSRCACCIYGSSETVFYISAVYFASSKTKKLFAPISISLFANFVSVLIACLLCRIL